MSDEFVNRVTLEYLLNKEMYSSQIKRKKEETLSKEDTKIYRKRLYSLFKDSINDVSDNNIDCSTNYVSDFNSSLFAMRSIKMDVPTLDKYVTRTSVKKKTEIIHPQQKDVNLQTTELKINVLKKNNITNKYEDKDKTEETQKE